MTRQRWNQLFLHPDNRIPLDSQIVSFTLYFPSDSSFLLNNQNKKCISQQQQKKTRNR